MRSVLVATVRVETTGSMSPSLFAIWNRPHTECRLRSQSVRNTAFKDNTTLRRQVQNSMAAFSERELPLPISSTLPQAYSSYAGINCNRPSWKHQAFKTAGHGERAQAAYPAQIIRGETGIVDVISIIMSRVAAIRHNHRLEQVKKRRHEAGHISFLPTSKCTKNHTLPKKHSVTTVGRARQRRTLVS